jgi:thiol:disulfide interchange protein
MKTGRLILSLLLLLLAPSVMAAPNPVTWTARLEPRDVRAGEGAQVVVEAKVEKPWHIYSLTPREDGPRPTRIELVPTRALSAASGAVQPGPHRERDKGFDIDVELYEGGAAFGLPVKVAAGTAGAQQAKVKVRYQACITDGQCLPPATVEVPVSFTVAAGPARADRQQPVTAVPAQPSTYVPPGGAHGGASPPAAPGTDPGINRQIEQAQSGGFLPFLWLSITMGFLALLTPCVFPMVPITVSFFAKQQEASPRAGMGGAVAYCLGIIGTFTGLGLLMSIVFGAAGISRLATNPWINLGLAVLFIVLALNLFGAFEIVVPGWLIEKTQSGAQRGSFIGPLLMGLTFTLTSFTCTVPFVGTLLATTATGNWFWPIVGMLGFSTAFASPFFLLALFPQWLARLPKSGSWLVTVKAYMGFLELAAAVKFLSNADLVKTWGLLTRPVFLALWVTIAFVAACYMLGWLRLPHDAGSVQIGLLRRVMGLATAVAGVYCLAGINGKSLGEMDAFLPPDPYPGRHSSVARGDVNWTEDYDAALAQAKETGKPLFLNFTGVTCTNCRWMEKNMFTRADVAEELRKFVTVELYTDREDPLSRRYKKLEEEKFGAVTQPLYAVITPDEKRLGETSFERDPARFISFLREKWTRATEQMARQ